MGAELGPESKDDELMLDVDRNEVEVHGVWVVGGDEMEGKEGDN